MLSLYIMYISCILTLSLSLYIYIYIYIYIYFLYISCIYYVYGVYL